MEGTVTKLSLLFALIAIILTVLIVFVMLNASIATLRNQTGLIRKIFKAHFGWKLSKYGLVCVHTWIFKCMCNFLFVYMCCLCISVACVLMLLVYLWYYLCIRIFSFLVFVCGGLGCNQRQCCLLYESDPPIVCDTLFNNTNIIIIIVHCYIQFEFWLFNSA